MHSTYNQYQTRQETAADSFSYSGYTQIKRKDTMNIHLALTPLISLIAGILILVMPRLLNFIVAIYLIVIGLVGLLGAEHFLR
jgi:archaellum biogenesis protein FlaJ (TadC family)